jgi:tRNA(fMet)-specific endonuclease VapC
VLDLQKWLASRFDQEFEIAAITVAEVWHGVERAIGRFRVAREQYVRTILGIVSVVPYTEQTAYEHARLWAEMESAGTRIGDYDLIVAATALERGSAVATFNKKHFGQVRGLKIIRPS